MGPVHNPLFGFVFRWNINCFFSRLKSFSFYHAFILLTVSYVAIAGGATIGYNVFGQYIPGMFFRVSYHKS